MSFTYKLYTGDPSNLADVSTIEGETFESQGTDVIKLSTTSTFNPGELVSSNVLAIHDQSGKKAIYDVVNVFILDPEIISITASPQSITGEPSSTGSISWEVEDNGETTATQRECTPVSQDTNIITLSNIDKTARTADYTLNDPGEGNPTVTKIIITSDFDDSVSDDIDVEVVIEETVNESEEWEFTTA